MSAVVQAAEKVTTLADQIPMNASEYDELVTLVKCQTGIHLAADKQSMIHRRLAGRLRALGIDSFGEYCDLIRSGDSRECELFTNAVTTNLTAFFREAHHFKYIADELLPQLVATASELGNDIRVWCAGCSTGEEPYTVAILIQEMAERSHSVDIKILATDVDTAAIAQCVAGVYTEDRIASLSPERQQRWFSRGKGSNAGLVRISPTLRNLIVFKPLNLIHQWPMRGSFDIIFCRNVIIYFDKATQKMLVERFAHILRPAGHLFLGHSESLMDVTDCFSLLGKSVYRRVGS